MKSQPIIFKGLMRVLTTLDGSAVSNQSFYSDDKHYCFKKSLKEYFEGKTLRFNFK